MLQNYKPIRSKLYGFMLFTLTGTISAWSLYAQTKINGSFLNLVSVDKVITEIEKIQTQYATDTGKYLQIEETKLSNDILIKTFEMKNDKGEKGYLIIETDTIKNSSKAAGYGIAINESHDWELIPEK